MAGLCAPLPTLRQPPREGRRTAWGRCGSLFLHRNGLAPSTHCRSHGALSINGAPHDDPARSNNNPARNDDRAAGDDCAARPSATDAIKTTSANNGVRLFDGGHHTPHYNEGSGDGNIVFFISILPNRNLRWRDFDECLRIFTGFFL